MFKPGNFLYLAFSLILTKCYGQSAVPTPINIVQDNPVNMLVGPENAVYCRLLNPQMFTVFEGFSRCRLIIDKMDFTQVGPYAMYSGTAGSMDLDFAILDVRMIQPEERATVTCTVQYDDSNAIITCSLPENGNNVRACTFRNSRGDEILITGAQTTTNTEVGNSVSSELLASGCSITIHNLKDPGQGIWRCSLRTETDIFYGFQTVFLRSVVEDISTITLEPFIRPNRTSTITGVEGEPVTLSCSIDAPIRYCYFRDYYSGEVINVSPDLKSTRAEYFGNGFEAGDCGLKLSGLQSAINLAWTCHIGVLGFAELKEETQTLHIYVYEQLSVSQNRGWSGNGMTVSAFVLVPDRIERCRFIRADGFSFSTDSVSLPYQAFIIQSGSGCQFTLTQPTELDLQPWVIATKIANHFEVAKRTLGLVEEPQPGASGFEIFVYVMLSAVLVALIVGIALGVTRFRR